MRTNEQSKKSLRTTAFMVELALLTALVVVLQLLSNVMSFGPVAFSLSLIPVVIGALMLGPWAGAFLGAVLGLVNFIASFYNPFLLMLFHSAPVVYILVCFGKTILAGLVAGLIYRALCRRHEFLGVCLASLSAPVVNTGVFLVMMALFFRGAMVDFFGAETVGNIWTFIMVSIITFNFFIEFGVNAVLCVAVERIIHAVRRERINAQKQ